MKVIREVVPPERTITAEFTQSEWNELAACFGHSSIHSRTDWLKEHGYNSKVNISSDLYNFLLQQVR